MPAVISGSLLAFAMSMDDVVISIFVNGPRLSTLPIKVYTQLKTGVTPEINALCTILLAATLVIFIVYSLITKKKKIKCYSFYEHSEQPANAFGTAGL